jgi:hypothetical protein
MIKTFARPQVVFDPAKKDHRKWVAKFFKTKSWKDCPVRFITNDNSLDISNVIQRQLANYYTSKEFKE